MTVAERPRVHVVACGALARELVEVLRLNHLDNVTVECLSPALHNDPDKIPAAVRARVRAAKAVADRVLVGYADCGTGGLLDVVCGEEGVERLPGAHCYELFAGAGVFAELHEREPGTFYLTDYLVRNFDRLVIEGLGIARHRELLDVYFGNYRRLVHLAQTDDSRLAELGRQAAAQLGLSHERRHTGLDGLSPSLLAITRPRPAEVAS